MNQDERAVCAVTRSLLQASAGVAGWSLVVTALALAVLALSGTSLELLSIAAFGTVALFSVVERYLSLRLRFDEGLFGTLADGSIASLASLDHALQALGLRQTPTTPRSLEARVQGTRGLLKRHSLTVALQTVLFVFTLLAQVLQ